MAQQAPTALNATPFTSTFLTGKIALLHFARQDGLIVPLVNGATPILPITTATISTKMDTPDASSYATLGFVGLSQGIKSAEITLEILYDKTAMPLIFAGMKADVELQPAGSRTDFLAQGPTNQESASGLSVYEYVDYTALNSESTPMTFRFQNCTVTQVTYDVPVKDVQKVKLTLIPSAGVVVTPGTDEPNFSLVAF